MIVNGVDVLCFYYNAQVLSVMLRFVFDLRFSLNTISLNFYLNVVSVSGFEITRCIVALSRNPYLDCVVCFL